MPLLALVGAVTVGAQEPAPAAEPAAASSEATTPLPEGQIVLGATGGALGDPGTGPIISTGDFIRMVLVLAVVVAAIYGVFFLIRRATTGKLQENELIGVLGSKILSPGRTLHVIRVGANLYLVGSADNSISLISHITDKETLDAVSLQEAESEVAAAARRPFQDLLADLLPGRRQNDDGGLALLHRQQERLRQLGNRQ